MFFALFNGTPMTSGELILIITTIGSILVQAINAIASGWGRQKVADTLKQTTEEAREEARYARIGRYQLQASIASTHAKAEEAAREAKEANNINQKIADLNERLLAQQVPQLIITKDATDSQDEP